MCLILVWLLPMLNINCKNGVLTAWMDLFIPLQPNAMVLLLSSFFLSEVYSLTVRLTLQHLIPLFSSCIKNLSLSFFEAARVLDYNSRMIIKIERYILNAFIDFKLIFWKIIDNSNISFWTLVLTQYKRFLILSIPIVFLEKPHSVAKSLTTA